MRLLELGNLVKGAAQRARRRAGADARTAQADAAAGQPQHAPGRRDRLHRARLQRALGHAGGARHRRTGAAAPHLDRQAVPGRRRSAARARLCHAHRAGRPHAQQHHRSCRRWSASWRKARQYGIARDNEELELGVRCMAAGIYDDQGKLVAGLSISAPADRLDEGWLQQAAGHRERDLRRARLQPHADASRRRSARLRSWRGSAAASRAGRPAAGSARCAPASAWRSASTQRRTRSASPMRLSTCRPNRGTP